MQSSGAAYTWNIGCERIGGAANITLTAKFTLKSYVITTSALTGGTVTGGGTYTHGTSVTLNASASEHYSFVGWYENGAQISSNKSLTFSATSNRTLEAKFTGNIYITLNGFFWKSLTEQDRLSSVKCGNNTIYTAKYVGAAAYATTYINGISTSYALKEVLSITYTFTANKVSSVNSNCTYTTVSGNSTMSIAVGQSEGKQAAILTESSNVFSMDNITFSATLNKEFSPDGLKYIIK